MGTLRGLGAGAGGHVLYVQPRNLGDAVIGTGLIEAIGRSLPSVRISVLTRPQFADIYARNPFVSEVYYASFPMGTVKNFGAGAAIHLLSMVLKLRRKKFSLVLQTVGDFRENLFAWAIAPRANVGPKWAAGHPMTRLSRPGFVGCIARPVTFEPSIENVYDIVARIAREVGPVANAAPRLYDADGVPIRHLPRIDAIGIHPLASQETKLWTVENWRVLIAAIRQTGLRVRLFGAKTDLPFLRDCRPVHDDDGTEIVTGSLRGFFHALAGVRALVGLDSFGMHAAYAVGTPVVMISGGSIPTVWAPPGTKIVSNKSPPTCYPCFNRPTCEGAARGAFRCIRDIPVEQVLAALRELSVLP